MPRRAAKSQAPKPRCDRLLVVWTWDLGRWDFIEFLSFRVRDAFEVLRFEFRGFRGILDSWSLRLFGVQG